MSMRMTCVQFSPDGNLLACGRENGQIELLNEPITVMRKEKAKTFALSPKQMQSHWEQLQNSNAKIAFVSMNKLILAHNQTIDFFTRQFKSIKFPTNNGKMNEPGTGKLFQNLRAIEVLERIGTNQAIQLLSHLAERSPTSLQSKAARDALQRFILP